MDTPISNFLSNAIPLSRAPNRHTSCVRVRVTQGVISWLYMNQKLEVNWIFIFVVEQASQVFSLCLNAIFCCDSCTGLFDMKKITTLLSILSQHSHVCGEA